MICQSNQIYSNNEVANNIAETDPATATLFKLAALGDEVGDCEGTPPIDDGGISDEGPDVGGAGGDFVGDEAGGVTSDFGDEAGVETGGDNLGEAVGAGALTGEGEAFGDFLGEPTGADEGD